MTTNHEPRAEFIQRLEERLGAEARRRNSAPARTPRWMPRSPVAAAAALAAVVAVSMGLGGAVVAARYQAQDNQQREQLVQLVARQLELAKAKHVASTSQLSLARQRFATGIEGEDALRQAQLTVVETEMNIRTIESHLTEVRTSGREPRDTISAPVVGGHDYVGTRLLFQIELGRATLNLEQARLQRVQQRFSVGAASSLDVATSQNHLRELETGLRLIEQKINIRRQFVAGQIDEPMAELRVLEAEAEQRRDMAMPKLQLARKVLLDFQARVNIGAAAPVEVKQAELRLYELEVELKKAELDLSVVRRQIDQRRGK